MLDNRLFDKGFYPLTNEIAKYKIINPNKKLSRPTQLVIFLYWVVFFAVGETSINLVAVGPNQKSWRPLINKTMPKAISLVAKVIPKDESHHSALNNKETSCPSHLYQSWKLPVAIISKNKNQLMLLKRFPITAKKCPRTEFSTRSLNVGTNTKAV